MKTISIPQKANVRDRGSKFTGYLFPCENEHEFEEHLRRLKSEFPDASHHCYAYRIDPNEITEFSSDDGEPSGTAGLPILNQLRSFEVVNAGLVVIRYFGGTKLGKSGLIEAYGECANLCLSESRLQEVISVWIFKVSYPYPQENVINKLRITFELKEQGAEYLEEVTLKLACEVRGADELEKQLKQLSHLGIRFKKLDQTFLRL